MACFAFHAPTSLKTFEIRPEWADSLCFTGSKAMFFHAGMKHMTFWTWHHDIHR